MEYQNYRTEHDLHLVRRCSEKTGKQIDLLQGPDGTMLICRVYDHPVPAYERLLGQNCEALPKIFGCRPMGNGILVEEEFVDGMLLSDLLEDHLLDTRQAAAVAGQVCKALEVLHRNGLVHRDVKPENILLTAAGRVVLLDLDAACAQQKDGGRDTQLLGTVGYAAPEQFGFGRSDARTDLFSLGVLMNVMITGRHPSQVLAEGPLRGLIETCTQMNADKRFSSAQALQRRLPGSGRTNRCPTCGFRTPGGGCIYCGKTSKRRRWSLAVAAAAAAVAALALLLWKPETPPIEEEPIPQMPILEAESEILPSPEIVEYEPVNLVAGICQSREPWEKTDVTAAFTYEDQTYYLAPAMWEPDGVQPHSAHTYHYPGGDSLQETYCVGFWTKDADGSMTEVSPEKRQKLAAAFDQLSLTIWAGTTEQTQLWSCEPDSACSYPSAIGVLLDDSSEGWWLLLAEGELDGQTVSAGVPVEWYMVKEQIFIPDPAAETDVLTQIAEWLAVQTYDPLVELLVQLPAGTYEGQLVLPGHLEMVTVEGALVDGQPATILEGGIRCEAGWGVVRNVEFRGCGKEQDTWPDGTPNEALYGDGGGSYDNCVFSDYACAVSCTGHLRFGGEVSVFRSNGVAFRMDSASHGGGNFVIRECTFLDNDVALWLRQISDQMPASYFIVTDCVFSDNGVDIRNEVDTAFRFPDNHFLHHGTEDAQLEILKGSLSLDASD